MSTGREMWKLAEELFPICRSLTGDGVRTTLQRINKLLGGSMKMHEVPSGTQCYDWTVPREWNIRDAYIIAPDGSRFCEFSKSNLHVMGYSTPIRASLSLEELQKHLYSLPDQPDLVPYITSYYKERWGFCLSEKERQKLKPGTYQVVIDSELKNGSLSYGEIVLPGKSKDEIFLSTYVCHPSMANNELSGPVVTTFLLRWLQSMPNRHYSIRAVFIPETIGSIVYLSRNFDALKKNVKAGFVLTCVGDDRAYSYMPSRKGNTLADRAITHVLKNNHPGYKHYSFLDRGSDERQYCSPGVDLPVASLMRTKYGEFPEYHTSGDDLTLVTPEGLAGAYQAIRDSIELIERNEHLQVTVLCEPQLGKRGLYPTLSTKETAKEVYLMMNLIAFSDGRDLLEIAETIGVQANQLFPLVDRLKQEGLLAASFR